MTKKNIKIFYPEADRLIITKDAVMAKLINKEMDAFYCRFNNDSCVEIDTRAWGYITLSVQNLLTLIDLIKESEIHFLTVGDEIE